MVSVFEVGLKTNYILDTDVFSIQLILHIQRKVED